jgi:hypothetical protein
MDTKHTPGPWEFVKYAGNVTMIERHERTGYGYQQTNIARVLPVSEALDANARLIAAAPDMLEALEGARAALIAYGAGDGATFKGVCAAIAKAKGGAV